MKGVDVSYCDKCKKYFKDSDICPVCGKKLINHINDIEGLVSELNICESMIKDRDKDIATFAARGVEA